MPTPSSLHHDTPPVGSSYLDYVDEDLYFDSHRLEQIACELGTPSFLVSENVLRANYDAIKQGLSQIGLQVRIRYCAKTNNEPGVLSVIAGLGGDAMASHLAEAQLALQCGFSPERIAFQRPVLDEEEVRQVLNTGITFFHAFRRSDLDLLERIASERQVQLRISLRLQNKAHTFSINPMRLSAQRLGFPVDELIIAAGQIQQSKWLKLEAINFYQGTQLENPKRYTRLLRLSARTVTEIYSRHGILLKEVNLGGGLPSPTIRTLGLHALKTRFSVSRININVQEAITAYSRSLAERFKVVFAESNLPEPPHMAVEPGRSIVGGATLLLSRVRAVHGRWAFLDASKNFLPENPYLFTRAILACRQEDRPGVIQHLSGNTLNSLDVIDFGRRLPRLKPGDLLALCDAGAYSISRATSYAGTKPAVYMLRQEGEIECIRKAGNVDDLLPSLIDRDSSPLLTQ